MDAEALRFILSDAGRAALAELATEPLTPDAHLATAERWRERLGAERAAAVLETALLRRRAAGKFSRAGHMFFTRDGLEQATAEIVAAHRAGRFTMNGYRLIADLGCGIGGDALALATAGATVIAIDLDFVTAAMCAANAAAYEVGERAPTVQADLQELPPLPVEAFFFDPARRIGGGARAVPRRRLRSVEAYRPPLRLIDRWRPVVPHGAVKVSPGIDYAELPPDAEVEFISHENTVKEAVLWFGDLRTGARRRATLLPGGHTITDDEESSSQVDAPRAYLYEPDGAVIRAHLVGQLARRLDGALIDPEIAYLTSDAPRATPFARGYAIDDHFPFQLKRLRSYLRERGVGEVTIKKRGSPLDPDVLRQALRPRGDARRVVFLTQARGRPTVLIGRPLDHSELA
jgi:SAM-dependent methyltransferase